MPLVSERKEKSQMLGDFLRELAPLILVFYTLDSALEGKFDWFIFGLVLIGAGAFLAYGMILEGRDEL